MYVNLDNTIHRTMSDDVISEEIRSFQIEKQRESRLILKIF